MSEMAEEGCNAMFWLVQDGCGGDMRTGLDRRQRTIDSDLVVCRTHHSKLLLLKVGQIISREHLKHLHFSSFATMNDIGGIQNLRRVCERVTQKTSAFRLPTVVERTINREME